MKRKIFKTYWIIIRSILYTAQTAIKVIFLSYCKTTHRKKINHIIHAWSKSILDLAQVHYEVLNPLQIKPSPHRAIMFMCNHTSLYDIPLSFLAFPHLTVRMLAKKELARIPLMAQAMKVTEFPFIDRKNRQQAMVDLKTAQKMMESGICIWIAPEGTRSKTGQLGPFKKGAFITAIQAQAIIIPICIKGAADILPARSFRINLHQKAYIHIGQPIDTKQYTLEQKEHLMETVRNQMVTLLQ